MSALLRHFERDAVLACAAMAVVAGFWPGGGWPLAGSVVAGGLLSAVSYRGVKSGVDAALGGPVGRPWALVKFFTRYAILAVAAYVMLARFRVSPVGLIAGASSLVIAAGAAAARFVFLARRPGNPD
jgi:hypothetical protein